ncbi:MAG: selenium cofactor biosynthesis protein YqeC [Bullifex sp.]
MSLIRKLADVLYDDNRAVISITGAGGKTSTLASLAREYRKRGLSVLITTTTKFQGPKQFAYGLDHAFSDETAVLLHEPVKGEIVYYAQRSTVDMKKYVSPRHEILSLLISRYDVTLIEADGAKTLPLKLHSERDPVILPETTATLALMGASACMDRADNNCFGYEGDELADSEFYQWLIDAPEGVLKRAKGKTMILINQCDMMEDVSHFRPLKAPCPIIMGSVQKDEIYV